MTEVIVDPMKNTIFINIFSTILALGITIPLGIFCAVHKGKKVDNTVQVVTMLGYSLPIYIIALIFMFFFCVLWRIFPISGTKTAGAIYATKWDEFIDMLYHVTLPGHRHDLRVAGRHDPLCAQRDDRRAEHGLHPHCARQGSQGKGRHLFPRVAQRAAADYHLDHRLVHQHFLRLGHYREHVLPERHGKLYWAGLNNLDFELVLAIQMFYTVVALIGSLLMDISYGLVDPRVRVDK